MDGKNTQPQLLTGIPKDIQLSGTERWMTTKAEIALLGLAVAAVAVYLVMDIVRAFSEPKNMLVTVLSELSLFTFLVMSLRQNVRAYKREKKR